MDFRFPVEPHLEEGRQERCAVGDRRLLANTVKAIPGVERSETMIVLSSSKEGWALDAG